VWCRPALDRMRVVLAYIGQGVRCVWCRPALDRMRVVLAYIGHDVRACGVGLHWAGREMRVVSACLGQDLCGVGLHWTGYENVWCRRASG
jgi:hypothetical protein